MTDQFCKKHPYTHTCIKRQYGQQIIDTSINYDQLPAQLESKKQMQTSTPRRDFRPVVDYEPEAQAEAYYMPTSRRNITDIEPTVRRNMRPIKEEPKHYTLTRTHSTRHKRIQDEINKKPPPTAAQMRIFNRKVSKRIEAAKKRALELVELGQEEVIEPVGQHKYGHMTEAAYKNAYKGKRAAMKQLKKGGEYIEELNDFVIEPEFTTYDHVALRNPKTGELVMAGRGSDTEFLSVNKNIEQALKGKPLTQRLQKGINDWVTNAKFMFNKHLDTSTYKTYEADSLGFAKKYNQSAKDIVYTGHSKAGASAEYMARKYGAKAHVFNPATHPTKDLIPNEAVHPDADINVYREEFDFVSGARTYRETPEFMKVHTYTTTPGTEDDLMGRHDHELAIPEPSRIEGENIIVKRNNRFRNRTAFAGTGIKGVAEKGVAGVKAGIMALPVIAMRPEYATASERQYRGVESGIDLARGVAEFEGVSQLGMGAGARGVGRLTQGLAPSAAIGAYTDLLMLDQQDNKVLHEGLAKVRHKIFGADAPEEEFHKAAKWQKAIMTKERRRQEEAREREYDVYRNNYLVDITSQGIEGDYLSFDEWIQMYGDADGYLHQQEVIALGYDPKANPEFVAAIEELEESFEPPTTTQGKGLLAYSASDAETLGAINRVAEPTIEPRISQRTQYRPTGRVPRTQRRDFRQTETPPPQERERFEMNGKTYVEVP